MLLLYYYFDLNAFIEITFKKEKVLTITNILMYYITDIGHC